MSIAKNMLAEVEQESIATRKCLERIPADKLDWKPADKSMSAGELGMHIASSPAGILTMLLGNDVSFPAPAAAKPQHTQAEIMAAFEASLEAQRNGLADLTDDFMLEEWRLVNDGKVLFSMPRIAFARTVLLSHLYHHRGQLSVYLRLLGVSVPSIYGPSADEMPDFLEAAAG